jgi:hypothetical protein
MIAAVIGRRIGVGIAEATKGASVLSVISRANQQESVALALHLCHPAIPLA